MTRPSSARRALSDSGPWTRTRSARGSSARRRSSVPDAGLVQPWLEPVGGCGSPRHPVRGDARAYSRGEGSGAQRRAPGRRRHREEDQHDRTVSRRFGRRMSGDAPVGAQSERSSRLSTRRGRGRAWPPAVRLHRPDRRAQPSSSSRPSTLTARTRRTGRPTAATCWTTTSWCWSTHSWGLCRSRFRPPGTVRSGCRRSTLSSRGPSIRRTRLAHPMR